MKETWYADRLHILPALSRFLFLLFSTAWSVERGGWIGYENQSFVLIVLYIAVEQ